jgi:hypothetical protein
MHRPTILSLRETSVASDVAISMPRVRRFSRRSLTSFGAPQNDSERAAHLLNTKKSKSSPAGKPCPFTAFRIS